MCSYIGEKDCVLKPHKKWHVKVGAEAIGRAETDCTQAAIFYSSNYKVPLGSLPS